ALSCGVPVVGSDSGEIPWVIGATGGGVVVPEGDGSALAATLGWLRSDAAARKRYASSGEQRGREAFSVAAVSVALERVLRRVVGPRTGQPRVTLVAHGIHDGGGVERACAELIRYHHEDVRFVAVTTELAPELEALVERWVRIQVPVRPIPLK